MPKKSSKQSSRVKKVLSKRKSSANFLNKQNVIVILLVILFSAAGVILSLYNKPKSPENYAVTLNPVKPSVMTGDVLSCEAMQINMNTSQLVNINYGSPFEVGPTARTTGFGLSSNIIATKRGANGRATVSLVNLAGSGPFKNISSTKLGLGRWTITVNINDGNYKRGDNVIGCTKTCAPDGKVYPITDCRSSIGQTIVGTCTNRCTKDIYIPFSCSIFDTVKTTTSLNKICQDDINTFVAKCITTSGGDCLRYDTNDDGTFNQADIEKVKTCMTSGSYKCQ